MSRCEYVFFKNEKEEGRLCRVRCGRVSRSESRLSLAGLMMCVVDGLNLWAVFSFCLVRS